MSSHSDPSKQYKPYQTSMSPQIWELHESKMSEKVQIFARIHSMSENYFSVYAVNAFFPTRRTQNESKY